MGIPIRIHFTFFLLLVLFGAVAGREKQNVASSILFVVMLFAAVVLHELGHAAVAKRYGVRTSEIVLYPIGGVARIESIPGGKAELLISLAGPAVNAFLAVALFAVLVATGAPVLPPDSHPPLVTGGILQRLMEANFILALFNLIPAFPMDGGRILRALLSMQMTPERATKVAATVGQGLAVVLGGAGLLYGNFVLIFIAMFVFLGATQEAAYYTQRATVHGRFAREAMITRFETLAPQDSLGRAAQCLLASDQQDFPVIDAWSRIAGILTRSTLLQALAREGTSAAVLDVMERNVPMVSPSADLEEVLRLLQTAPSTPVLVVEEGRLAGIITLENLVEFIELARRAPAAVTPPQS